MAGLLSKQDKAQIKRLIEVFRAKPVIGLFGAGMSVPLGYPTWHHLMEQLVECLTISNRLDVSPEIELTLASGNADFRYFAQWIVQRIHPEDYQNFLQEVFSPRAGVDYSSEHELLVHLPTQLIATTNYDNCLTEALREFLGCNISVLDNFPFKEISDRRRPLNKVVHLHGNIEIPGSIILTSEDYIDRYKRDSRLTTALKGLAPLSLFFVGYSFNDHDFNACLEMTNALLEPEANEHFALLPRFSDMTNLELDLKTNELRDRGIHAFYYPVKDGDHSARAKILELLFKKLDIAVPKPKNELTFFWKEKIFHPSELRKEFKILRTEAGEDGSFVLRYCSMENQMVRVAFNSLPYKHRVEKLIANSEFWISKKPEKRHSSHKKINDRAVISSKNILKRNGKPFLGYNSNLSSKYQITKKELENEGGIVDSETNVLPPDVSLKELHRQMLHALALGLIKPDLNQSRELIAPLFDNKLKYGQVDCFHPVIDWRLDSPIIHSWHYYDDDEIREKDNIKKYPLAITVVGDGLPKIWNEIESIAYSVALSLPDIKGNIITKGLIHLTSIQSNDRSVEPSGIYSRLLGPYSLKSVVKNKKIHAAISKSF